MGDEGKEKAVENVSKFTGTDHEVRKYVLLDSSHCHINCYSSPDCQLWEGSMEEANSDENARCIHEYLDAAT